jgi:hypothetical protein
VRELKREREYVCVCSTHTCMRDYLTYHIVLLNETPVVAGIGLVWFFMLHLMTCTLSTNSPKDSEKKILKFYRTVESEVEVTLRPTISRPVCLGVLPLLEKVTRCCIYLGDNYFLYFSCRAPSLTRGRVCNLQCNDACSISSYIATYGLSATSSWCRSPDGTHNQILISLFDSYFVFSVTN